MNLLSANGAEPNAFTSSDMTCYYFQCTKSFEENLRLLLHFVSTPYFTPETVQKEQGIIAQEILMGEDNPGMAIYYQLLRQLYARHPIRDRVAGTVESISGITDKTLYDCHRAFYAPSNMALCVEGDVDPERIYAIALEALPQERMPVPHADYGEAENLLPAECFASREMPGLRAAVPDRRENRSRPSAAAKICVSGWSRSCALRLLAGGSSPFYSRLYAEGLLCRDFDYEVDFAAGTGTVIFGGESQKPEQCAGRAQGRRPRGYPPRALSRSALNAPSGHPSAHACADSRISTMCASRSRARPLTGTDAFDGSRSSERSHRRRVRRIHPRKSRAGAACNIHHYTSEELILCQPFLQQPFRLFSGIPPSASRCLGNLTINPPSYFTVFGFKHLLLRRHHSPRLHPRHSMLHAHLRAFRHQGGRHVRRHPRHHPDGDNRRAALLRALRAGPLPRSTRSEIFVHARRRPRHLRRRHRRQSWRCGCVCRRRRRSRCRAMLDAVVLRPADRADT